MPLISIDAIGERTMNPFYQTGAQAQSDRPMNPICPHCHSSHTRLIDSHQLTTPVPTTAVANFSPMALANVGIQLSKRLNLPPMLGGMTGLVIGGVVLLFLNSHKPIQIQQYQCEQCQETFEVKVNVRA